MKILPLTNQYKLTNGSVNATKPVFGAKDSDTFVKSAESPFELKAITSKTAQRLLNMDYIPKSAPRDGYFLTYVLNRDTSELVDIYVKQMYSEFLNPQKPFLKEEKYCFYRENPNGELLPVGTRLITLDTENNKISTGFMESKDKTLLGLGLREQQTTFERMMDCGYDNIHIISVQDAYDFHAKCGFKSDDYLIYRSGHDIEKLVDYWRTRLKTDEDTVRKMLVFKTEGDIRYLNINKTREKFVIYLNEIGRKIADDIGVSMRLSEDALNEWIKIVKLQPILLNKLKGAL